MRKDNRFGTCSHCGKPIIWIRTLAGKNMPVDTVLVNYRKAKPGEKATDKIVLETGEVISACETNTEEAEGIGYISHFATCTARRKK